MGVTALDKHLKDMDSRVATGALAPTLSEKRAHLQCRWATSVGHQHASPDFENCKKKKPTLPNDQRR